MKMKSRVALVLVALSLVASDASWAKDAAHTYKSKCSHCHGAAGEGKMGPALKGTSLTADDIAKLLTTGDSGKKAPHSKPFSGATPEKAKALADYIKGL